MDEIGAYVLVEFRTCGAFRVSVFWVCASNSDATHMVVGLNYGSPKWGKFTMGPVLDSEPQYRNPYSSRSSTVPM